MAKILIATEKPFAKVAVDGIKEVAETAGLEIVLLRNIRRRHNFWRQWPTWKP